MERPAAVVNKSPPPPVIETLPTLGSVPVQVERIRAPVRSYTPPNPIPIEGAVYMIRWGDTLWDISDVFYRNPWRYRFLARYNGISNPNLIISGKTVRIPPTD